MTKLNILIILFAFTHTLHGQNLQEQLFTYNLKQLAQTKQIPKLKMVNKIEQELLKSVWYEDQLQKCKDCRYGINYAFSRLFWLSGDMLKAEQYLKQSIHYSDQSNATYVLAKAKTSSPFEHNSIYFDDSILQQLDQMIEHKQGKEVVLFLTGFSLVHQYYLSRFIDKNTQFEHIVVEGASTYEILPLLFDIYSTSLSSQEKELHIDLLQLAEYLEEAYTYHEEAVDYNEMVKSTNDESFDEFSSIPLASFDGKCTHLKEYREMLLEVFKKL